MAVVSDRMRIREESGHKFLIEKKSQLRDIYTQLISEYRVQGTLWQSENWGLLPVPHYSGSMCS